MQLRDDQFDVRDPATLPAVLCMLAGVDGVDRRVRELLHAVVAGGDIPSTGLVHVAWTMVEALFARIYHHAAPVAALQSVHLRLQRPLLATLLLAPEQLSPEGAVALALNEPLVHGLGATDDVGRALDDWLAELDLAIAEWVARFSPDADWWAGLAQRMRSAGQIQRTRVEKLEQRLIDSELGALRALRADHHAVQLINLRCEGRVLPAEIVDFIHGPWRDSLRLICLNDGQQSTAWREAVRATNNLVRSCAPIERDEQRQQAYKLMDEVPQQVAACLRSLSHQPAQISHWLDLIGHVHLRVLQGQPIAWVSVSQLAMLQPMHGVAVQVQSELHAMARGCAPGQWFHVQAEGEETQRCKLTAWLPDTDCALFINWLGQRVACHSSDELAVALASGWMRPIDVDNWFAEALAAVGEQYHLQSLRTREAREEARQQREAEEREEAARLARQRDEREARERARIKAEIEARRLAEHQLAAEQAQRAQALQERRQEAEQMLDALGIGSWVDLELVAGEPQVRAKLAVKMPSTGKMVFVDRIGVKVADLAREDLLAMFAMGRAVVHRTEAKFEDALVRIVDQLRRDRRDAP